MSVTYLETVIFYCLKQINKDRTVFSVFHLLNGKKSSQTIQDAHLFQLTKLFQTFSSLTRNDFLDRLKAAEKAGLVQQTNEHVYLLTDEGEWVLAKELEEKPFPAYLNGWTYHSLTSVFWERLSLFVQVCSNLIHCQTEYIPVQRKPETQAWLKKTIQQSTASKLELSRQLYGEICRCFEKDSKLSPEIFIIRLSGYQTYGLTSKQAADFFHMEDTHYHIQFLNLLHFMIKKIKEFPDEFPLLNNILVDLSQPASFTLSTSKTYSFLKRGYTIGEIASARNLKLSTIEDHIVEIALIDKMFDITEIVPVEKQKMIMLAAEQSNSKQLKRIRELTNGINYFEIRLVLAKFGDAK
ncbi:helix-turn-helix domain-containing protein [Bacillus marasmi]|uniref:helix-turn-helix domain-containing protein n=1 Tax=Bacillus marasmi TaxID=1926279 RepID=UPI0011C71605|nr:helix-turn-helix domain-containing protein [Bacillus marasmi]